jgi:hypothetical protein
MVQFTAAVFKEDAPFPEFGSEPQKYLDSGLPKLRSSEQ